MDEKRTTFASEPARTVLPRSGIGAARVDVRPTLLAYDLAHIPDRAAHKVFVKPQDAVPGKPIYEKAPGKSLFRRKRAKVDPFVERLSRLG